MSEVVIYEKVYQCVEIVSNKCTAYQEISGSVLTTEMVSALIGYALLINIHAMGIRSMRDSF